MKRKEFLKTSTALLAMTTPGLFTVADSHAATQNLTTVCSTCGTHFLSSTLPKVCNICADDRQYVPEGGQAWTAYDQLLKNSSVRILKLNEKVYELQIKPTFAIGQRALLVLSDKGNILWDCIPLLNEPTIDFIKSKGGLNAIAFSHPHYYSNMNEWAEVFDCPIYIHQSDEPWIFNKGHRINLWSGADKPLWDGIKTMNIGGHFPGSSILHVPSLSKEGAIFTGDTLTPAPSKKHIAVMYSYPNRIPLPLSEMTRIKKRLDGIPFDTLYGFYSDQNLYENVKEIIKLSMQRYT